MVFSFILLRWSFCSPKKAIILCLYLSPGHTWNIPGTLLRSSLFIINLIHKLSITAYSVGTGETWCFTSMAYATAVITVRPYDKVSDMSKSSFNTYILPKRTCIDCYWTSIYHLSCHIQLFIQRNAKYMD